jgi:uncharacterized protein
MSIAPARKITSLRLRDVRIDGGYLGSRIAVNRDVTLPIEYRNLKDTGRIDAWRLDWEEGKPNKPHIYWDSDVAKWIEAAAYSLTTHSDSELERMLDEVVDLIVSAQADDGYLNSYYQTCESENRWTNLLTNHELYCAGHLIEAAVALHAGLGKAKLLDAVCRYADLIDSVFGPEDGKKKGYPGHEEIELALVKLYHTTGEQRYLKLSQFFVEQRGTQPHYYDAELIAQGNEPRPEYYDKVQAHLPVREQSKAAGHAVRAMYLYSAMADLAAETGDATLLGACEHLWDNVTLKRMYVTGGVGSTPSNERFTYDYDLPNETAYAETCAAIGLVFWAQRMLSVTGDGRYADVVERALYNGVLAGVSLSGDRFSYVNPLAFYPPSAQDESERFVGVRQPWFECSCCPPNVARLLAGLGSYVYGTGADTVYIHQYLHGSAMVQVAGTNVELKLATTYPADGTVNITVTTESPADYSLAIRVPGWCESPTIFINGEVVDPGDFRSHGYAHLKRTWNECDVVTVNLTMAVRFVSAHPSVRQNAGRIAITRGPVVYCLEEADNGPDLNAVAIPIDTKFVPEMSVGVVGTLPAVVGEGSRMTTDQWAGALYQQMDATVQEQVQLRAIPYAEWANREPGEMLVWIRER